MADRISTAARDAAVNAVVDLVDVGTTNAEGRLRIYTGTQPATANDTIGTSTLLVEILLAAPAAYGASSSGSAALLSTPRSAAAVAAGTAGWFRVVNRNAVGVFDGAVTGTGGGGELELDNTSIASAQTVNVNSLAYSQPGG